MARIHKIGEARRPLEQRILGELEELPDVWQIFFALRVATPTGFVDCETIAIGENQVFVLASVPWQSIALGMNEWLTEHGAVPSGTAELETARLGVENQLASSFPEVEFAVRAVTVLGASRANVSGTVDDSSTLVSRRELCDRLRALDDSFVNAEFRRRGDEIALLISKFESRDTLASTIGNYKVLTEAPPTGKIRNIAAVDSLNRNVLLRCYPYEAWGTEPDTIDELKREANAILSIEGAGANVLQPFHDATHDWYVTPLLEDASLRTLQEIIEADSVADTDIVSIGRNLFQSIAGMHERGVLHRGLCPTRIKVSQNVAVTLHDFFLARLNTSEGTIRADPAESDAGFGYRAPEMSNNIHAATQSSDVYAAAKSLQPLVERVETSDRGVVALRDALNDVLESVPAERPTAQQIYERLDDVSHDTSTVVREEGTIINERYELIRPLGSGSFAETWLATDLRSSELRTIKFFKEGADGGIKSEFSAASRIKHRNCARVWDISDTPAPGILVAEYVEGQTLDEWVKSAPTPARIRKVLIQLIGGLGAIHGAGLLHKDLSPNNVIVGGNDRATIIDFGLASPLSRERPGTSPRYQAPEVAQGHPHDELSDLYSIGAMAKELFTDSPSIQKFAERMTAESRQSRPRTAREALELLTGGKPSSLFLRASPARWNVSLVAALVAFLFSFKLFTTPALGDFPQARVAIKVLSALFAAVVGLMVLVFTLPSNVGGPLAYRFGKLTRIFFQFLPVVMVLVGVFVWFGRPENGEPVNPGDAVNCVDFRTQGDAQQWFDSYFPFFGDVGLLDEDGDGVPCESLPESIPVNPGNAVNCSDFLTQVQAQEWFDTYFGFYGDVAELDQDDDGEPCESLP